VIGLHSNSDDVAAAVAKKAAALGPAVQRGTRSALLAVEGAAVKNLSGSNDAAPWTYPVPARTGNLKNARGIAQEGGTGIITFFADYAWAIHSGRVMQFAGRSHARLVQRAPRPFADDAVKSAHPETYIIDAVKGAMAV
jgi:hypothetical protein